MFLRRVASTTTHFSYLLSLLLFNKCSSINAAKLHELKQIADELKHKASSQVGEDPDLVFLERIRVTPIDFANYSERDYAEGEMDGACSRAYAAMALADLIEAMSFSEVSRKYGIPPGDLQKLQEVRFSLAIFPRLSFSNRFTHFDPVFLGF